MRLTVVCPTRHEQIPQWEWRAKKFTKKLLGLPFWMSWVSRVPVPSSEFWSVKIQRRNIGSGSRRSWICPITSYCWPLFVRKVHTYLFLTEADQLLKFTVTQLKPLGQIFVKSLIIGPATIPDGMQNSNWPEKKVGGNSLFILLFYLDISNSSVYAPIQQQLPSHHEYIFTM